MWRIPVLRPGFPLFFSMDNLRGYGEDEPSSSSGLGPSAEKLPSCIAGSTAPLQTQAPVMAGSPSAVVPVMSGPVPPVSAQSGPSLSVPQDSVSPPTGLLDDLLPPPPPAEPYEDFLARVGRELSNLTGYTMQPAAAVPRRASVMALTTGTSLPTPFPRFEDSCWALQSQVQTPRIRMPLPASCYTAPPSPWVWPGRGSTAATSMVCAFQPASLRAAPTGPHGPSGRFAGPFPGGPSPVPPPPFPAPDPNMHFGFFPGATPPFIPTTGTPAQSSSSSVNSVNPTMPQKDTVTISQGPTPEMIQGWKEKFMVTLHLSKQWVPLFRLRTWAPTRCGSWVALTTERHHGLSVRPGQNEQTVASVKAVDPARGPLLTDIGLGSGTAKCLLTPPPRPDACLLPPNAHGWTIVTSPVRPVPQKVVSVLHGPAVLGYPAHHFHAVVVPRPLLHLTTGPGIARLPLVGLSGPAWLGGMLGVHPCRHAGDHLLLIGGHDDHPGPPVIPSVPDQGP